MRSAHWSSRHSLCTSTSALRPSAAHSASASTVLPKPHGSTSVAPPSPLRSAASARSKASVCLAASWPAKGGKSGSGGGGGPCVAATAAARGKARSP